MFHFLVPAFILPLVLSLPALGEPATRPATDFSQGTFVLTMEGTYAHSFVDSHARVESGTAGVGFYFLDNISISAELTGFAVQQPGPDAGVYEADLMLRHHLLNAGRFSLYLDVAGGVSCGTERVPEGGTYFNYTIRTGLGASWRLADHLYLTGGVRYLHFSNADLEGREHNPSVNAVQGYGGVMFTF